MKSFFLRLLVTSIVLYALGAVAYGLLHYPTGERPDAMGVLGDFTRDMKAVFERKESGAPSPNASGGKKTTLPGEMNGRPVEPTVIHTDPSGSSSSLDALRGDAHLSLKLNRIEIPDLGRLPAAAAEKWAPLQPIHATVLPEAIAELSRLRGLASTDTTAFERDRSAVRTRLKTARDTLAPLTQGDVPPDAATQLLNLVDEVDAKLAAL